MQPPLLSSENKQEEKKEKDKGVWMEEIMTSRAGGKGGTSPTPDTEEDERLV